MFLVLLAVLLVLFRLLALRNRFLSHRFSNGLFSGLDGVADLRRLCSDANTDDVDEDDDDDEEEEEETWNRKTEAEITTQWNEL